MSKIKEGNYRISKFTVPSPRPPPIHAYIEQKRFFTFN